MATLDDLVAQKELIEVRLKLRTGQFPERKVYAFPDCVAWMRDDVPRMVTGRIASDFTPHEQLVQRLRQWIAGEPMEYGRMFRDLEPRSADVWEMKTADLRLFGWMYRPRQFIAVSGGFADEYKEPTKIKNYADDRKRVVEAREALTLDGDKFLRGNFDELV